MAKVYVGIGHGGSDPGAVANGYKEKDLTLAIGKACYDELVRHGVQTKISRTTDKYMSVNQKVKESDSFGADYCLDIHINAGGGDGCEVYHHHLGGKSKQLAGNINEALKAIGQNSRGLKVKMNSKGNYDYFGIIRDTKASAVLVECGFIDNKTDLAQFNTAEEQKKFGIAIAHGILKQCGIAVKSQQVTKTDFIVRTYKNGSTKEAVYSTTADCKAGKNSIGNLDKYETCDCVGKVDGCYIVVYKINGANSYKVGFVKYSGGVE